MNIKCHECGSEAFNRKTVELVTRLRELAVTNRSVTLSVCSHCGAYTIPVDVAERVEQQAALTFLSDVKPVTGDILRFARKALDLTQVEAAELLGAAEGTISKWENGKLETEVWVSLAYEALLRKRLMGEPEHISLKRELPKAS